MSDEIIAAAVAGAGDTDVVAVHLGHHNPPVAELAGRLAVVTPVVGARKPAPGWLPGLYPVVRWTLAALG